MAADTHVRDDERGSVDAMAGHNAVGLVTPHSRQPSLAALLDLSREMSKTLVPVQPRPEYRSELYRRLLAEARRQQALRALALPAGSAGSMEETQTMFPRVYLESGSSGRRWLIGAAAVGSAASLVGLWAYVQMRRHGKAA
jgi:hypothetical protein